MKYAFLVAWREYAENAKTKGFWIGMFMFPLIIFISVKVSILLETKGTPVRYYVLVDQSGKFANSIESRLDNLEPRGLPGATAEKSSRRHFLSASLPAEIDTNTDLDTLSRVLKPYLRGDKSLQANGRDVELAAAILIPRDIDQQIVRPQKSKANAPPPENGIENFVPVGVPLEPADAPSPENGIEYWSANLADTTLRDQVEQAVNGEIRRREYLARGMDAAAIREVEQTHAPFVSLNPKKETGKETVSEADIVRQWAPSGFVYLLWVAIFGISQMLLNNIIEEKSNRILEVLLSSVTPGELMMGKLFGIAAVGLTMVTVWISALFAALSWKTGGATAITGHLLVTLKTSNLIPMFSIYFLLGYLMYAAFILALGSVCNTIKEAQNYMGLITMTMMVPLLTMTFIPKDPNGTLARILSWIPIYTPFTMMNRVNADPPLIDLIGTAILLLVSTAGALWMAGKIFRIGILRTGQPPKIVEMLRWLKS